MAYRVAARLGAMLYIIGAVASIVAMQFRPLTDLQRSGILVVCLTGIAVSSMIWVLPWQRWARSRTLILLPVAFCFISVGHTIALNPLEFTAYLLAGFIWLGAVHPRGTSLRLLPLLWVAYLAPIVLGRSIGLEQALPGLITTTFLCLIVGETLAWLVASLRRVHEELATQRIGARYRALVRNVSDLVVVVDAAGRILFIAPSVERMLGFAPSELRSHRLTELFAEADASEALRLFERLSRQPGSSSTQEWRMAHVDGSTRVIEAVVVNLAEDPDIGGIVLTGRDVTERHALETQLSHEALHDSLTGLANRLLFRDRVAHAIARTQRQPGQVAVLFLDLDEFKDVNDSLGHQTGDIVLQVVADRLSRSVRAADTVARLGGDEFAILIEDGHGPDDVTELAERLLDEVRRPITAHDTELEIRASVGIVFAEPGTTDAEALVRDADIAMYAAKDLGKDRIEVFHPEMQARISDRLQLVADLRRAIDDGELEVVYQPFIELSTERMVGVEALVRWQHPARGLLPPSAFIGAAEESGLIVALGGHVLREACAAARAWAAADDGFELVSVNLSPRQFTDEHLVDHIAAILDETGLPPELLVLEITENVLIGDLIATGARLQALRAMGVRIAIDDFGMGYSSLNYLRALPVDILKIDRAFVTGLGTEEHDDALVEAIIELARVMGLETIAEAVEQHSEAERLRELGAHLVQGFYFSRPVPAAAISRTLAEGRATAVPAVPQAATLAGATC